MFLSRLHREEPSKDDIASCRSLLVEMKREAVEKGDQNGAKHIWCLEQVLEAHLQYQAAFQELKSGKFYEAWCTLERIEITLLSLSRHLQSGWHQYQMDFLEEYVEQWQSLFPYKIFMSPEFVKEVVKCSICSRRVTPRNPCGHRVGEIYDGEMCCRIVEQAQLLNMAMVENPVQKYSVPFMTDPATGKSYDHYDYSTVNYAVRALHSPYDRWSYVRTQIRHPHERFGQVGRNKPCPCGSGKKYKKCCLNESGILAPHIEFKFQRPPPLDLPRLEYVGDSKRGAS
jgi:hypothetical protein